MSYVFYKWLHLVALFVLMTVQGAFLLHALSGSKAEIPGTKRKWMMVHGITLFLVFLAGFGLLARLGVHWPWPLWVWVKIAIWLFYGAFATLLLRCSQKVKLWAVLHLAALILAVWAVLQKWSF